MAASRSGFPLLLERDQVTADQPYNLFERSVDWQTGGTRLFVGTRKTITPSDVFLDSIAKTARRVQQEPKSLDAAIFCATGDWIVWWDHAPAPLSEPVSYFEGSGRCCLGIRCPTAARTTRPDGAIRRNLPEHSRRLREPAVSPRVAP